MGFKVYPSNLIFILLVAAPNLLFLLYPPVNTPVQPKGTLLWTLITCFEKIGQMGVFIIPIFLEPKVISGSKKIFFVGLLVCLLIYYIGWGRYFLCGREYRLLFQPFLHIPIPMAIAPILYFVFVGTCLDSFVMIGFSILLAIGHIPESYKQFLLSMKI